MLDYLAYLTAQREVRDAATSALPGAPVRPDLEAPAGRRLRRRAAQVLARTAARRDPGAVAAQRV
jgi:cytidylate kinase